MGGEGNIEIRDSERARIFLLQSLLCGRIKGRADRFLHEAIGVAYELASESLPLLPLGMVADFGQLALARDASHSETNLFEIFPHRLNTLYEDIVLGKVYVDSEFERASQALARYQGREQLQALAYLTHRIQSRGNLPAVQVNPAVIRNLQRLGTENLIEAARDALQSELLPEISEIYEGTVHAIRQLGQLVGPEDIFELESGTALGGFGQRIALRQIMRVAGEFEKQVVRRPVIHESQRRRLIATQLQEEDAYPVGGFTSISTRGSIESLLHSQLVFMETDEAERPDLFDIKFLRDELLYYARDENQFLRQRRTYIFTLHPNLEQARVKDSDQSYQRLIYGLAMIVSLCNRLAEWLSEEALRFEIIFIHDREKSLDLEQELFRLIFKDRIAHGLADLHVLSQREFQEFSSKTSFNSLCHIISLSTDPWEINPGNALLSQLRLNKRPSITIVGSEQLDPLEKLETWQQIIPRLVEHLLL